METVHAYRKPVRGSLFLPAVVMLVAMLCSETALSRGEFHKERLFIITRNKNDNMVCYDAHSREGKLDAKEPLGVYWIIPQKDNKVEKLSSLERSRAYGFDLVRSFGGDSADFKMKALPRKLRVKRIDEKWVALMTIDSVEAILTSAYVMAGSGIMPKVQWVRLDGVAIRDSVTVSEVIKP